ncbi:MAG TPA: hypothetical protein PLG90_10365 [Ignavibacteria bacterium]|nr:hypothetical protein [Ignavibacteria bacterium]
MKNKKKFFVIAPIKEYDSIERRRLDDLIKYVFKPVVGKMEYEVISAHEVKGAGNINSDTIRHLNNSNIVLADLTNSNPNVMYELGICHTQGIPVIHIALQNSQIPFDMSQDRIIFYEDSIKGGQDLRENLEKFMIAFEKNELKFENPVIVANYSDTILKYEHFTRISPKELERRLKLEINQERNSLQSINKNKIYNTKINNSLESNNYKLLLSIKVTFQENVLKYLKSKIDYFDGIKLEKNLKINYSRYNLLPYIDALIESKEYFYIIVIYYTNSKRCFDRRINKLINTTIHFNEIFEKNKRAIPMIILQDEFKTSFKPNSFYKSKKYSNNIAIPILKFQNLENGFTNLKDIDLVNFVKQFNIS